MCHSGGVAVDTSEYQSSGPGSFPVRGGYDLLSRVGMVNLSCRWLGGGSVGQKVLFRAG